jgi:hypothetical protein
MKWNILIDHKKIFVVCETLLKSELISLNYNVLLTTLEINTIVKSVVHVTTKSTSTCTNYGKIGHTLETES